MTRLDIDKIFHGAESKVEDTDRNGLTLSSSKQHREVKRARRSIPSPTKAS